MKLFGKFPQSFPKSLIRGLALFAAALFVVGACLEFSINSSLAQTTPTPQTTPAAQSAPQAGRGPRYVEPDPINFDDHTGWQSLFDGVSLKGLGRPHGCVESDGWRDRRHLDRCQPLRLHLHDLDRRRARKF